MQFFLWPDTRSELLRSKLSRGLGVGSLIYAACLGFLTISFPISILGIRFTVIGLATLAQKVPFGTAGSWISVMASLVAFIVPVAVM